jgi:hypothetical protein
MGHHGGGADALVAAPDFVAATERSSSVPPRDALDGASNASLRLGNEPRKARLPNEGLAR